MNWLTSNWRTLLHPPLAPPALMLVAVFCGVVIGTERERREKPAGLRTLTLVCLGSAAFTMAGFAFTGNTGDSGRVAAQIVTGIGFLGAGVILHPRGSVSGATTAASIWVTASVGMIAGAGYAGAAVGMSFLVRFVLVAIAAYEGHLFRSRPPVVATLDFDPAQGRTRVHLERILIDYPVFAIDSDWKSLAEGVDQLIVRIHLPRHHLQDLLDDLVSIPEVKKIHQEHAAVTGKV